MLFKSTINNIRIPRQKTRRGILCWNYVIISLELGIRKIIEIDEAIRSRFVERRSSSKLN